MGLLEFLPGGGRSGRRRVWPGVRHGLSLQIEGNVKEGIFFFWQRKICHKTHAYSSTMLILVTTFWVSICF